MTVSTFTKPVLVAGALIALPQLSLAQETDTTPPNAEIGYIFTTFMFLVTGFLVMWMAAGFTMLEAGLVRQKNVTMQLTKNVALFSIAAVMYYLLGYNLMYPGSGWSIDGILGAFATTSLEPVGLADTETDLSYASVGSDFYFQLMFCATTASIVSGTLAERIKLWPFLLFVVVLTGLIYPIQASWKWGGGFLAPGTEGVTDFLDFAGSTVVHSTGGWAALAGALILGPRLGKYGKDGRVHPIMGSNLPLATLGTLILWLGWFGFNGGSQLYMDTAGNVADMSRIFANTNTAAAGIWGTLAVVLTNPDASLGRQVLGIVVVGIFVFVVSAAVWMILKATMGMRVSEEEEVNGLDMAELGMEAYPEFSKG